MPENVGELLEEKHKQHDSLSINLNEELEYSDFFFTRNYQVFFNNLSVSKQSQLIDRLQIIYAQILFNYFTGEDDINCLMGRFIEKAFFVNLPMNQVIEIHMDLIDNLERQLKSEGLQTQNLRDFRLVLIDVIAHLGEMYRNVICE